MSALAEAFAKNLKTRRSDRNLSQRKLAQTTGLSVSYVSMLERGVRSPPLETVELIAKGLSLSPVELLSPPVPATRRKG